MFARFSFSWSKTALLLLAVIVIFTITEGGASNLDCRRFVFAPACRGATIKRSSLSSSQQQMMGSVGQEGNGELVIKYPQVKATDEELAQPVLMWIDRRPLKLRWPTNDNQIQSDGED